MMVTPIMDPVVESSVTPALYPVPPVPALSVNEPVPVLDSMNDQVHVLVASSLREVAGSPDLDKSSSYLASPTGSGSGPIPSLLLPSLQTDDVSRPMDQYLPHDTSLLSTD